ncbi:MAG: hypothetical protein IJX87_03915, partial [Clostridia bacterium]|nr:hypothetical protein [Clostridia bacterium]
EVPPEKAKIYAAEKRRRRYISAVMAELDISITSLEVMTDNENETLNGEHALSSLAMNLEDSLIEKMEKEELHKKII